MAGLTGSAADESDNRTEDARVEREPKKRGVTMLPVQQLVVPKSTSRSKSKSKKRARKIRKTPSRVASAEKQVFAEEPEAEDSPREVEPSRPAPKRARRGPVPTRELEADDPSGSLIAALTGSGRWDRIAKPGFGADLNNAADGLHRDNRRSSGSRQPIGARSSKSSQGGSEATMGIGRLSKADSGAADGLSGKGSVRIPARIKSNGSIPQKSARAALERVERQIRSCYERLKPSQRGASRVTAELNVLPSGKVQGARIGESTASSQDLPKCVLRAVKTMRFKSGLTSKPAPVTYFWNFGG